MVKLTEVFSTQGNAVKAPGTSGLRHTLKSWRFNLKKMTQLATPVAPQSAGSRFVCWSPYPLSPCPVSLGTEELLSNAAHRDFRETSSTEACELLSQSHNHIYNNEKGTNFEETWSEDEFHGSSLTLVAKFVSGPAEPE